MTTKEREADQALVRVLKALEKDCEKLAIKYLRAGGIVGQFLRDSRHGKWTASELGLENETQETKKSKQ